MSGPLMSFAYLGGKSFGSSTGVGRWIARLLPYRNGYAEVCGGMASILLNRTVSPVEVLNDRDGHIVHFWRVVRDNPSALEHQLHNTPYSEAEYRRACAALLAGEWNDDVVRARDIAIVLWQNHICTVHVGSWKQPRLDAGVVRPPDIKRLSNRLRDVVLYNRDAVEILAYLGRADDFVIYVDPPYSGDTSKHYSVGLDRDSFRDALLRQRNAVALSGYDTEWDDLLAEGWRKETLESIVTIERKVKDSGRIEAVWMNYDSDTRQQGRFF